MSHECTPCGKCGACSICERCICKPIAPPAVEKGKCDCGSALTSCSSCVISDYQASGTDPLQNRIWALEQDLVKADEVIKALTEAINRRTP